MIGKRHVLVTGFCGFIDKNLVLRLRELRHEIGEIARGDDEARLPEVVAKVARSFTLPARTAPRIRGFQPRQRRAHEAALQVGGDEQPDAAHDPRLVHAGPAEQPVRRQQACRRTAVEGLARKGAPAVIFHLPSVFGKWCRPNYNLVVATFCHNIARDLPVRVDNPGEALRLVYIDHVVAAISAPWTGWSGAPSPPSTPRWSASSSSRSGPSAHAARRCCRSGSGRDSCGRWTRRMSATSPRTGFPIRSLHAGIRGASGCGSRVGGTRHPGSAAARH